MFINQYLFSYCIISKYGFAAYVKNQRFMQVYSYYFLRVKNEGGETHVREFMRETNFETFFYHLESRKRSD